MSINEQITAYIDSNTEPKRKDLQTLHNLILQIKPNCRLWFLDGKNDKGNVVTNPNIGYGLQILKYADGKTKEFYQVGLSSNTTGISIYVMGIEDKTYLPTAFGKDIGKASVTGYCIKFKALKDINIDKLKEVLSFGLESI